SDGCKISSRLHHPAAYLFCLCLSFEFIPGRVALSVIPRVNDNCRKLRTTFVFERLRIVVVKLGDLGVFWSVDLSGDLFLKLLDSKAFLDREPRRRFGFADLFHLRVPLL